MKNKNYLIMVVKFDPVYDIMWVSLETEIQSLTHFKFLIKLNKILILKTWLTKQDFSDWVNQIKLNWVYINTLKNIKTLVIIQSKSKQNTIMQIWPNIANTVILAKIIIKNNKN